MNKTASSLAVLVVAIVIGWYVLSSGHQANGNAAVSASETIATVNGTPITRDQLTAAEMQVAIQRGMSATSTPLAQFQASALDTLIGQALLEQAAQKVGITASSTEIDAQIASVKAGFTAAGDYQKALIAHGMTEADLRSQMSIGSVIKTYLFQNRELNLSAATATPAEIKTTYSQVVANQNGAPPLNQIRSQLAQMIVQQKQQSAIDAFVAQLRAAANVNILIATSTPATQP